MVRAQCLVHLGRSREAVELTQSTLRASGDDPEVLYAASLVYSQAGDRASALVNAKLALEKGVQPRWFTLPAFGPLRNDPELRDVGRRLTLLYIHWHRPGRLPEVVDDLLVLLQNIALRIPHRDLVNVLRYII